MAESHPGDQFSPPGLNRTMERGNWFLHYNEDFIGDVLIRHKEFDHLEVRVPFEAFKDLVAESSKSATVASHNYKISFYREDEKSGGCIRDSHTIKAWTAQDAVFQFELKMAKTQYANDRYFRVLEIEPDED